MSTALTLTKYKDLKKKLSPTSPILPAAYIVEANDQSLIPWSTLQKGITIKIPNFPEIQSGDEFRIILSSGVETHAESTFATNNYDDIEIRFALSSYLHIVGFKVDVYYFWNRVNVTEKVSTYYFEEQYPLPIVEEAKDGVIDSETANKGIKIRIPRYEGMAVGDLVTFNYLGNSERDCSIQRTVVTEEDIREGALTFSVDGDITGRSVPGNVTLHYSAINSTGEIISRPSHLKIESLLSSPQPDQVHYDLCRNRYFSLRFIEHNGSLVAPVTVNTKYPIPTDALLSIHVLSDRKYQSLTLYPETTPSSTVIRAYIPQRSLEALNGQTIIMAAVLEQPDGTVVSSTLDKWTVAEG